MIIKILLVVLGTALMQVAAQQTITTSYSDAYAGSYKAPVSGYQAGSSRSPSGYQSGTDSGYSPSAARSYGTYPQSTNTGSYRAGPSYNSANPSYNSAGPSYNGAGKSAASTYKCTTPYCKANPCFANSLPYHCTLEQCYEALNAQNDFTIFVPNTITVPKCFFYATGFKLFSYNICMKDTVPCTGTCEPASATDKEIICSWNTWRAACLAANFGGVYPPDGYVFVSPLGWACALWTYEDVTLECQIKAFNEYGEIIGFSNPFKIYITAENIDCPWPFGHSQVLEKTGACAGLEEASAVRCLQNQEKLEVQREPVLADVSVFSTIANPNNLTETPISAGNITAV